MSSENSADSTRNSEALIKANTHKDKEAFISLGKEESQNADVNCWRGLMSFFFNSNNKMWKSSSTNL